MFHRPSQGSLNWHQTMRILNLFKVNFSGFYHGKEITIFHHHLGRIVWAHFCQRRPRTNFSPKAWSFAQDVALLKTRMTGWKITIIHRGYIFIHGCCFFPVSFVSFRGVVVRPNEYQSMINIKNGSCFFQIKEDDYGWCILPLETRLGLNFRGALFPRPSLAL